MTAPQPRFDLIARPYRWFEYITFGRALERCRLHFLPQLHDRSQALVLGDGDGRFLARLLQQNTALHADAVDTSSAMLILLRKRCQTLAPSASNRLRTHQADAIAFLAASALAPCDLVVTHFFLDCFTQSQLAELSALVASRLTPGALWLVSDFRIPDNLIRLPATLLIRALYLAFRVLAKLRVDQLPDHASALSAAGFELSARHLSLFGILTTELWTFHPQS